jgi:hypothetical protein
MAHLSITFIAKEIMGIQLDTCEYSTQYSQLSKKTPYASKLAGTDGSTSMYSAEYHTI